jgi:hypothetical protein
MVREDKRLLTEVIMNFSSPVCSKFNREHLLVSVVSMYLKFVAFSNDLLTVLMPNDCTPYTQLIALSKIHRTSLGILMSYCGKYTM